MATTFKEGDRVQIVDREATAEDTKAGLFFSHMRGLTGTIQKLYANEEAVVEIEQNRLSDAIAQRHLDVQEQMKTKWLDGLSEEARNRLSDQERDFRLRYSILVASRDLIAVSETAPPRRTTIDELSAAEEAELRRRKG